MGQEISGTRFSDADFARFLAQLQRETALLADRFAAAEISARGPFTGCEIEACLIDDEMNPAPMNEAFLACFGGDSASAELAKFDVEFNTAPLPLHGPVLGDLERQMSAVLAKAKSTAESLGLHVLLIGILPTLRDSQLNLANLSDLNRYHALNERVFAARGGQPIQLNIAGNQHLETVHHDVMLEAAATSFQIHWQIPAGQCLRYYNAALTASAPLIAISANSPYLFGLDLWAETRIPLFEQAVPIGGYDGAAHGPLQRVSFGTGRARHSIVEVFVENLEHFPILLPVVSDSDPADFTHLRLHNGTIWRWNRPLVGFDADRTPHIRLEHRSTAAGPSVVDMAANAAFYFGLVESLAWAPEHEAMPFAQARDNFYLAAQHGLPVALSWDGERRPLASLLARQLLPKAREGLVRLGIDANDINRYLGIIDERVATGTTGSDWQRRFIGKYPGQFRAMTREYLNNQASGQPVHTWPL